MSEVDVLVIGGGISGLSVGWWLTQKGIACEIWEQKPRPGGKIGSQRTAGYLTERSASLIMNFRPEVTQLIQESGLNDEKRLRPREAEMHRYLLHEGRLEPLPTHPLGILHSPLWSWRGKLRLLAEPLIPRRQEPHESVARFVARRLGPEILEKAMEPFVGGTLAADAELADARATLPRLTALEQRYGSITLGVLAHRLFRRREAAINEAFSFQEGISALVEGLASTLSRRIHTNRKALKLTRDGPCWRIEGQTKSGVFTRHARHVVLSTPAPVAGELLTPLDEELGTAIGTIPYAPLAVLHMGFSREQIAHPLDGSGFLTPASAKLSFNGNLWMSSLFPNRAPEGKVLLSSYIGGCRAPQMVHWETERVVAVVRRDLGPIIGLHGEPEWVHIDRHPQALPLYHGDYQRRLSTIERRLQRLPGLHLTANYRGGISVRDRIVCGAKTAAEIARQLERRGVTEDSRLMTKMPPYEHGTIPTR